MDKTKKKSIKRYILWGVLALVVVLLAVMPLMARQQQAEDGPTASILSANAAVGSIRSTVHGGGTLEAGDPENISIPWDVKITEFLVNNGDMVSQGDALAAVDKVSVMTAITEIQDSMSIVEKQMENYTDEKADTTVSATAGGRVKLVYAEAGDRVESVMLEHGALAVLSLDGKMSVTLTASAGLSAGDAVTVTLADGTEVTGRVESNLSGEIVVTVEDKEYQVGQTVTVETVGTGTLEIHSPWNAAAFTGTVSQVYAKPEQTLNSGASLFTLKDTDYTAQREILANTHREYEELLQKLFKMYETGVISAPCDGMVSGIDKDSAHLLAAQEEEIAAQPLTAEEGQFRLVLLSSVVPLEDKCTISDSCPLPEGDPGHDPACPHACDGTASCPAKKHREDCLSLCISADQPGQCTAKNHKSDCIEACAHAKEEGKCTATKHYSDCIESCISTDGCQDCPALIHKPTCIESCTHADTAGTCKATLHHYTDCIESCIINKTGDTVCPASKHKEGCYFLGATFSAQVFKVSAVGTQALVGYLDPTVYPVVKTAAGWAREDGKPFDKTLLTQLATLPAANAQQFKEGDIVLFLTVTKGEEAKSLGPTLYERSLAPSIEMPSFTMPSFSFTMSGISGSASSQTQLYDLVGDVLMTVTPQDTMTLTVSVDESDISNMKTGMPAEITINALSDQSFEGEITKVAQSGSGNGGSSKFDVEITLSRESEMLAGMSASAVISLYEKMDVLTLPAAALSEDGAKTIVYTALDKKTGEPAAPVEVTTGISDGETVEILSGLGSGDTVYYAYYDVLEESDAVETDRLQMH